MIASAGLGAAKIASAGLGAATVLAAKTDAARAIPSNVRVIVAPYPLVSPETVPRLRICFMSADLDNGGLTSPQPSDPASLAFLDIRNPVLIGFFISPPMVAKRVQFQMFLR